MKKQFLLPLSFLLALAACATAPAAGPFGQDVNQESQTLEQTLAAFSDVKINQNIVQATLRNALFFAPGSARLTSSSLQSLRPLTQALQNTTRMGVQVAALENSPLCARRAQAIFDYLVNAAVSGAVLRPLPAAGPGKPSAQEAPCVTLDFPNAR